MGSIWMRPNGGLSASGTQNMQSSTGQYSTQAGDPAQPVQHSVITASSFGFFFRAVTMPFERGSCFSSSGTIPGAFSTSGALAMSSDFTLNVKPLSVWLLPPCRQSGAATMPVQSDSCSAVHMFPKSFFKHIVPALLAGLGLRLFFIWHFPFYSGDTAYYEELARNWLYHRVYGFYSNGRSEEHTSE